jgi:hypothetical protein
MKIPKSSKRWSIERERERERKVLKKRGRKRKAPRVHFSPSIIPFSKPLAKSFEKFHSSFWTIH